MCIPGVRGKDDLSGPVVKVEREFKAGQYKFSVSVVSVKVVRVETQRDDRSSQPYFPWRST